MSRLTPVASPIDTFVRPGLSETTGFDQKGQLAAALSRFNSNLQGAAGAYLANQNPEGVREAAKIQAENQFKNMDAFREAVKAGKLKVSDNPWTIVHLEQLVAREGTRDFLHGLESSMPGEVRNSRNPRVVSDWIDSQASTFLQGQGHWGIAASTDIVSQWKAGFLNQQIDRWNNQRELATKNGYVREAMAQMEPIVASIKKSVPLDPSAFGSLQTLLDSHTRITGDSEAALKYTIGSIQSVAAAAETPELVDAALDNLKMGEKSLKDVLPEAQVKAMKDSVLDSIAEDQERKRRTERDATDTVATQVIEQIRTAVVNNQSAVAAWSAVNTQIASLPPAAAAKVHAAIRLVAEPLVRAEVAEAITTNGMEAPQTVSLLEAAIASNAPGAIEAASQIQSLRNRIRPQTSDPVKMVELFSYLQGPHSSRDKASALASASSYGWLSERDEERGLATILATQSRVGVTLSEAMPAIKRSAQQIANRRLQDPEFQSRLESMVPGVGSLAQHELNEYTTDIELELADQVNRALASNPSFGYPELDALLTKRAGTEEEKTTTPPEMVDYLRDPEKAIDDGKAVWNKGFQVGDLKVTAPLFFKSADEVRRTLEKVMQKAGIKDTHNMAMFIREQQQAAFKARRRDIAEALGETAGELRQKAMTEFDVLKKAHEDYYQSLISDRDQMRGKKLTPGDR